MTIAMILLGVGILALLVLFFGLSKRMGRETSKSEKMDANMDALRKELHNVGQMLSGSLSETRLSVKQDLQNSGELMANIHNRLGELSETSKRIHDVGQNIAGLQELLRAPKIRGGLGEYFLEDLLKQIIPSRFYKMQHMFSNGRIVDAAIQIGPSMVPIDSKFPLETFKRYHQEKDPREAARLRKEFFRGVRKHIDDICSKYILPDEGTYDFALMYIPAENVYYETIIRELNAEDPKPLFEYAVQKKVIPVSPNSIYAYLQVILLGLKGFEVETRTKDILGKMLGLKNDLDKFETRFHEVGKGLSLTSKKFELAENQLTRFGGRVRVIEDDSKSTPRLRNARKEV